MLYSQEGSQLPYLPFMSLGAVSPPAIHNLDAVECSQDEEGPSYSHSHRNQHPRHVSCLKGKEKSRATLPKPSFQSHFHQASTAINSYSDFLEVY